jgi:putative photosynthetic complex assembly protein 2
LNDPWIAALVALFLWWFLTGAILFVVQVWSRRGVHAARAAVIVAFPVFLFSGWVAWDTAGMATPGGVYHGFLAALGLWGWIEMAFLTGVIAGPNRTPCRPGIPEWERFIRAWGTIAYHEIALFAVAIALTLALWGAANPFAALTFGVLYVARLSAKLNLFVGVPKINTEFLTPALSHLPGHFRVRAPGLWFALSVAALAALAAFWVMAAVMAEPANLRIGFALLAAMNTLAVLEHGFMVMRLPDEKLWRWMMPAPRQSRLRKTTTEDAHGL